MSRTNRQLSKKQTDYIVSTVNTVSAFAVTPIVVLAFYALLTSNNSFFGSTSDPELGLAFTFMVALVVFWVPWLPKRENRRPPGTLRILLLIMRAVVTFIVSFYLLIAGSL